MRAGASPDTSSVRRGSASGLGAAIIEAPFAARKDKRIVPRRSNKSSNALVIVIVIILLALFLLSRTQQAGLRYPLLKSWQKLFCTLTESVT
jgi:hypothetical protein